MNSQIVTLPLEDPFDIPENIVVDIFNSKFSDDETDNIITSFVYLRNIEYSGKIDFSTASYQQKEKLLQLYLTRDIKDLKLEQLDFTLFKLFLINDNFEDLDKQSILNKDEIKLFAENNFDILANLECFIHSIPYYVLSLDKSEIIPQDLKDVSNIEKTDDLLDSYECALNLLKYRYADLMMFLPTELLPFRTKAIYWNKYFYYDNYELADLTCGSIFSTIYSEAVQSIANDKEELLQSK